MPAGVAQTLLSVLWQVAATDVANPAQDDNMNRTAKLFRRLKSEHRCGLIAYVTCGDGPTVDIIRALEDAGPDAHRAGRPLPDPIADGPVIQLATQRALQNGPKI